MDIESVLDKHERIALQCSGGKDSLAVLYLMRPYWDRLTVYWLDTGDAFPETVERMGQIAQMVPHFVRIQANQPAVIAQYGIPTDMLPASATPIGIAATGNGVLMQDRYSCCMRSLMLPLHAKMIEDGITLVVRGQKDSDRLRSPLHSGAIEDGLEYLFPLEDWDDTRVYGYLLEQGVELPRFYQLMNASPDCLHCSAYWEEGRAAYLKEYHPAAYQEYQRRLNAISAANAEAIAHFNMEIGA
jgi:phosphoadenosine phosphosulfate reductase